MKQGLDIMGDSLEPGTRVEVRGRFEGRWSRGFEIAGVEDDRYRVRRMSDGWVLPATFTAEELRPERRRREGLWWY